MAPHEHDVPRRTGLTLTRRIALGFGMLTLLTGVVGLLSWRALEGIARELEQVQSISAQASEIGTVDARLAAFWPAAESAALRGVTAAELTDLVKAGGEHLAAVQAEGLAETTAAAIAGTRRGFQKYVEALATLRDNSVAIAATLAAQRDAEVAFDPAIQGLGERRKLMFDAEAVATLADLRASLLEGRRRVPELIADADGNRAPDEVAGAAGRLRALWDGIGSEVRTLSGQANGTEEVALFERLTRAVTAYATGVARLAALLDARGRIRQTQLADGRDALQRALARMREDAQEAQTDGIETARGSAATWTSWFVAATALLLLAGCAAAIAIGRSIALPLRRTTAAMRRLAGGETEVDLAAIKGPGDVQALVDALRIFRANALSEQELRRADALRRTEEQRRLERLTALTQSLDGTASALLSDFGTAASQLQRTAQSLTQAAERSTSEGRAAAEASRGAALEVEAVASASEQLTAAIHEIARQAAESRRITGEASTGAADGARMVATLEDAALRIGEVSELIARIANQTNLLALNATIEAARAGDAGKGFAVVAAEVKALASETGQATGKIGEHIDSVRTVALETAKAIQRVAGTIVQVEQIATGIAGAVQQQAASMTAIDQSAARAANSAAKVLHALDAIANGAEVTGKGSADVLDAATTLSERMTALRESMTRAVDEILAA